MDANLAEIENRLWSAADELRANSRLRASEYSTPVLGLIFLRYADHKFTQVAQAIDSETAAVSEAERIREHSTKRAAHFTYPIPHGFSTSSICQRVKTSDKRSLTL